MPYESYFSFNPDTLQSFMLLGAFIFYLIIEVILSLKNKAFEMDAAPLTKQYLFKQSLRIPCLSSLYFGILSWVGHTPQFNNEGFINFIEISKLPIALLSLTIPFVIVVNNIHRTIQTDKQIEEAKRKNIADSYYSHFKHIVDYFTNLPPKTLKLDIPYVKDSKQEFKFNYPIHLYKFIYNENDPEHGVLSTNRIYMKKLTDLLLNIVDLLENLNPSKSSTDSSLKKQAWSLNEIEKDLTKLHKMMCIDIPSQDYHFYYRDPHNQFLLRTNFSSAEELADRLEIIYQFIINVLEITVMFDFNDSLKEDTGNLKFRTKLLRDLSANIFRECKFFNSIEEPTFVLEPYISDREIALEKNGGNLATN
ncbi:hypothetical protein ACJ6TS_20690 [Citrobacter telavivensis]